MINLLPPELKDHYVYGRRNVTLRRWAIALSSGFAGVIVVLFAGLILMEQSVNSYEQQVANSETLLKEQKLEETTKHAESITSSVKLAVDVLSREILFSKLLTQIATVIPPNTNLTDLSISKEQDSIEIKAVSADYTSATQLQVNLQDPANKIFSKADIQSISCGEATDTRYPCSVTIKALFNESNPFLFINKSGQKR
jgi:Tfp pilus assembly protein PilN